MNRRHLGRRVRAVQGENYAIAEAAERLWCIQVHMVRPVQREGCQWLGVARSRAEETGRDQFLNGLIDSFTEVFTEH